MRKSGIQIEEFALLFMLICTGTVIFMFIYNIYQYYKAEPYPSVFEQYENEMHQENASIDCKNLVTLKARKEGAFEVQTDYTVLDYMKRYGDNFTQCRPEIEQVKNAYCAPLNIGRMSSEELHSFINYKGEVEGFHLCKNEIENAISKVNDDFELVKNSNGDVAVKTKNRWFKVDAIKEIKNYTDKIKGVSTIHVFIKDKNQDDLVLVFNKPEQYQKALNALTGVVF